MKAVFLTLLLGVVCAAQEAPAQPESSEITGNWYTIYMAADNKEKIEEGGPLRTYFRQFECIDDCERVSITFILTKYDSCTLLTVVAQRAEGNVYHVDYSPVQKTGHLYYVQKTVLAESFPTSLAVLTVTYNTPTINVNGTTVTIKSM